MAMRVVSYMLTDQGLTLKSRFGVPRPSRIQGIEQLLIMHARKLRMLCKTSTRLRTMCIYNFRCDEDDGISLLQCMGLCAFGGSGTRTRKVELGKQNHMAEPKTRNLHRAYIL